MVSSSLRSRKLVFSVFSVSNCWTSFSNCSLPLSSSCTCNTQCETQTLISWLSAKLFITAVVWDKLLPRGRQSDTVRLMDHIVPSHSTAQVNNARFYSAIIRLLVAEKYKIILIYIESPVYKTLKINISRWFNSIKKETDLLTVALWMEQTYPLPQLLYL